MSSSIKVTLKNDDVASVMEPSMTEDYINLHLTRTRIKILVEKTKLNKLLLNLIDDNESGNDSDFQMASQAEDSMLLMAEQETQEDPQEAASQEVLSQEEGPSQNEWKCPKCTKRYKHEKTMRNHLEKVHGMMDDSIQSIDERAFAPNQSSTHESAVDLVDERKRKRSDDEESEDGGEKPKGRARMSTIDEEIDDRILDDTMEGPGFRTSTQGLRNEAAEEYERAERNAIVMDEQEGEDLDASINRDRDKALANLEKKIKQKDDLLHNRCAKLADREAEIAELNELNDQKERLLFKANREIQEKDKKIQEMWKKLAEEKKRGASQNRISPEKEKLKDDVVKGTAHVKCLNGRVENLKRELDEAKKTIRRQGNDEKAYEKVRISLENTLMKLSAMEEKVEDYERERAKLLKRIPCTRPDCRRGNDCENSHKLRYEDRSEPKVNNWRKTILCKFFAQGYCEKSDEECNFIHDGGYSGGARRRIESVGSNEDSFNNYMNQRFKVARQDSVDSSIEVVEERKVNGGQKNSMAARDGANRYSEPRLAVALPDGRGFKRQNSVPAAKRRRTESTSSSNGASFSGNGQGASLRPQNEAPMSNPRSSRVDQMRRDGSRSRSRDQGLSRDGGRPRNWSPIRSPEDLDRSRPRDRDLREEIREMRGRGQQMRGSMRGRRGGRYHVNNGRAEEERRNNEMNGQGSGRKW